MSKPFNLQEALAGKPVVTRDGIPVANIVLLSTGILYGVAAIIGTNGYLTSFTQEGRFTTNLDHPSDLFMKDQKRIGWVNVWKNDDVFGTHHATTHYSLAQAIAERTVSCSGKKKTLLARFQFEYED